MPDQPADGAAQEALRTQVQDAVKASGLKQTWIADKLNVSEKHLSQLLIGRAAPTLDWAEQILALCGARLTINVGDGLSELQARIRQAVQYRPGNTPLTDGAAARITETVMTLVGPAFQQLRRERVPVPLPSINANDVQGFCPACGGTSLFLAEGGYVTCSRLDCPCPDAASTVLERDPDNARTTADNPATSDGGADNPDDGLRDLYAAAIRAKADGTEGCANAHRLADAVLAVRDRRLLELAAEADADGKHLAEVDERCDRYAAAIARVRALHVPNADGECIDCRASFDPCPDDRRPRRPGAQVQRHAHGGLTMTTTPLRTVTTTLTRTVDGDTQHHALSLDLNLRLARINCPELSTAAGQAAKVWAAEWYAAHAGPYTVTIHGLDNWGRYIADVAAVDGHNLSDDLLAAGQAAPYKLAAQLATKDTA